MLKRTAIKLMPLIAAGTLLIYGGSAFAEDAKPPLLPPLTGEGSQQTYMQAVWVIIIFVILLAILYPTAWKNVLAGLKKREERIRADIANAEIARSKAESTLREYAAQLATAEQKARDIISQAAMDAEKIATTIRMKAQQEGEEAKERATREIEVAKNNALTEIYEQTASLATSVAEKILRRSLNADDQRDLVNRSLEELQSVSHN